MGGAVRNSTPCKIKIKGGGKEGNTFSFGVCHQKPVKQELLSPISMEKNKLKWDEL